MLSIRTIVALFVLLLSSSLANAQPLSFFLDNFASTTTGPPNGDQVSDNAATGNAVWAAFGTGSWTGTVGGRRILGNQWEGGSFGGNNNTSSVVNGRFNIFNDTTTRSRGQLIWDGGGTVPTNSPITAIPQSFLLNKDVFAGVNGTNFNLEVSVLNADLRTWTYTVRAYTTNASNYFEAVITTNTSGDGLTPASFFINVSQFAVASGTPSWNDIDAITFDARYANQPLGGDLAISFLQFVGVPEMSTYLMIGLSGLLVGSFYAYRRGSKGGDQPGIKPEATVEESILPVGSVAGKVV